MNIQSGGFIRSIQKDVIDKISPDNPQERIACHLKEGPAGETLKQFIINVFSQFCFKIKDACIMIYGDGVESQSAAKESIEAKANREIAYENPNFSKTEFKLEQYFIKRLTQRVDENNVITYVGFSPNDAERITTLILNNTTPNNLNNYMLKFKDNNIHNILGAISHFHSEPEQAFLILNDEELFNEFIRDLIQVYNLPESYTKEEFLEYFKSKLNEVNVPYFIFRLVTKLTGQGATEDGVIQRNYAREIFVRKSVRLENPSIKMVPECHRSMKTDETQTQFKDVSNWYSVENTFHKDIFEKYRRKYIGGVSGSFFYLHFVIFKILKYPLNFNTYAKVICMGVLDYVPIWHSLEEILLTVSAEIEKHMGNDDIKHQFTGFKRYTLDQDPIDYFKKLLTVTGEGLGEVTQNVDNYGSKHGGGKRKTRKKKQKKRKTKKKKRKKKKKTRKR